jgi:hypothetical protein
MTPTNVLAEQIVIDTLRSTGPCFLDDLIISLSHLSWTDIFMAVDRMSRDGRVSLRQVSYSKYEVIPSLQLDTPRFQVPPVVNFPAGRSTNPAAMARQAE